MLAFCLEDGLTCNRSVYRRGQIFILPSSMEAEFGGLSDSQLVTKLRSVYGRELFRFPSSEEILTAFQAGKITTDMLNKKEVLVVARWQESTSAKKTEAARVLRESVETEYPELKEEVEEDEPAPFVSEGAEVETPPVLTKEDASKPQKPTRPSTRRTTKKTKK